MIFFVFGFLVDDYLGNPIKILQRCGEKSLPLNCKKCHFMVKKVIVLGHVISYDGIEVDKAKIDLIANIPLPLVGKILSHR